MHITDVELYREQVKKAADIKIEWDRIAGKTILLTGAAGMIGSFLADVLMRRGDVRVIAVSRTEDKAKERFRKYLSNGNLQYIKHDINNPINISEPVHYVLHAASNTHPQQYSAEPIGTVTTNIIGTKHLLDLAAAQSGCRLMYFSSVEIYGENRGDTDKFTEDYCGYIDCSTVRAGYPESKRTGEALCMAYIAERGVDAVIARISRVYGPTMQEADSKAIAQFIRNCANNEPITLKSTGTQLYSYTYVADAVTGLLYILLRGNCGEAYNIASGGCHDITLLELAQKLAEISNTSVNFETPDIKEQQGYSKATKAVLDSAKIRNLGWQSTYSIEQGLKSTVEILRQI